MQVISTKWDLYPFKFLQVSHYLPQIHFRDAVPAEPDNPKWFLGASETFAEKLYSVITERYAQPSFNTSGYVHTVAYFCHRIPQFVHTLSILQLRIHLVVRSLPKAHTTRALFNIAKQTIEVHVLLKAYYALLFSYLKLILNNKCPILSNSGFLNFTSCRYQNPTVLQNNPIFKP